ncbi:MAG: ribonuclease P protein component [Tenericutes bacterium HGW-Tenericutes-5]|nr:MAG: ribonuclease P protein component [Tenericutes bacterium HGW-Tenericutes-5]
MKKKFRIKKSDEIQQLMSKRNTVGNSYFVLYYQKNHDNVNFRFALSVSKKLGKAHERNLMKRRIREVIKTNSIKNEADFFIIAKLKSKDLVFSEIKNSVEDLLKKANLLEERVK